MGSIAQTNDVYIQGDFSEPMSASHDYTRQHDLADPEVAMARYSQTMHQHTKEQFELAQKSARRRSGPSAPLNQATASLRKGSSSSSVSSTDS